MWLKALEKDVEVLLEFRRFLVRNGVTVTVREESATGFTAFLALMELRVLRPTVLLFGPF